MNKVNRKKLIVILNKASDYYYNSFPTMSDNEREKLYDELERLEKEENIIYPDSPIQIVGYKVLDSIPKVLHNHPMLSLNRCHLKQDLIKFDDDKDCIISVKCDWITISLHYINGELIGAETIGNGIEGSDIL